VGSTSVPQNPIIGSLLNTPYRVMKETKSCIYEDIHRVIPRVIPRVYREAESSGEQGPQRISRDGST
jgi:hypothetical protein